MKRCPICFENKKLIFNYKCIQPQHGICNECFLLWRDNKKITCPECRALEIGIKIEENNKNEFFNLIEILNEIFERIGMI